MRSFFNRRVLVFTLALSFVLSSSVSASDLSDIALVMHEISIKTGAPVAENFDFSTYKNIAYYGTFFAHDPDGDSISFQLVDKPARGALTIDEQNAAQFVYTPYENKTGKDSFSYIAIDSNGNESSEATVDIVIEKPDTKVNYVDMADHPAHNAAIRMAEENILVGTRMDGEYYFQPELTMNRSEFLVMAMSALDLDKIDCVSTGFFDDHAIETWAKPYVSSALKAGVIQGKVAENGQIVFMGEDNITVADAAVILNNLLSITDIPVETASFDISAIPTEAYQSVVNLESVGILRSSAQFMQTLDRATAAEMLFGALSLNDKR